MIIVNVKGGLGNQMFQYALYFTLKTLEKDAKLCIDHFKYSTKNGINIPNHGKYFLVTNVFDVEPIIATPKETYRLGRIKMDFLSRGLRKLGIYKTTHILEKSNSMLNIDDILSMDDIFLDGYWQDFSLFERAEEALRNELVFRKKLDDRNAELSLKIKTTNSVCVHVRRSDYLLSNGFAHQTLGYYNNAFGYFKNIIDSPHYYCFSDDIKWCKESFKQNNIEFIDWNTGEKSFIDMQLMSMCKNNIVTNSSFSVWAAWLNLNPNKIVIRPEHYYSVNDKYPWPKEWVVIKTE